MHPSSGGGTKGPRRRFPRITSYNVCYTKLLRLELAGNLGYPVAIIASASLWLIALGVFLFLTRPECGEAQGAGDETAARPEGEHF